MRQLHGEGVEFGFNELLLNELSLIDLADLPVDALYIDKSTITGIKDHTLSQQMADCIIHLGRIFHFKIYAEGIKTQQELDFLKQLSPDFYYIEHQPGILTDFIPEMKGKQGQA